MSGTGSELVAMWRYVHARTVARVWPRLKRSAKDRSAEVDRLLRALIETRGDFSILQIGAYDGISNDHAHHLIREYAHVRATLLEPQPGAYEMLCRLWQGTDRVSPVRCAIADCNGERPLYVIAPAYRHLHPFADQVASFSRAHVATALARYVWRPPADAIAVVSVPTIDWPTLVHRHGPFDFVAIDAEGYDGEVIHQIDFRQAQPDVILYEHQSLSRPMRERCIRLLAAQGYLVRQVSKTDTIATRTAYPSLARIIE